MQCLYCIYPLTHNVSLLHHIKNKMQDILIFVVKLSKYVLQLS